MSDATTAKRMEDWHTRAIKEIEEPARADERNKAADFLARELERTFGRWTFGSEHDVVKRIREGDYEDREAMS